MSNQSDSQSFVYVNLNMAYTGANPNGKSLATTSVTNSSPILRKPSDWYGMVSRFSIDTFAIPLIVPRVVLNQPDFNKLEYHFAIGYNGVYSDPINVIFVPSPDPVDGSGNIQYPASPVGNQQDLSTSYYYVYLYSQFLEMWNTALDTALINLSGKTTLPVGVLPPKFYYDPTSGIVFKAQKANYAKSFDTTSVTSNKLQVYFDGDIVSLINGMTYIYTSNFGIADCRYQMVMTDLEVNSDSTNTYWLIKQQNISELSYWSSSTSIQIQTNMPVSPEYTQRALGTQGIGQQNSQTISLLTDFIPDRSVNPSSYHTQLVYNKTDSLRLFDMISDSPLFKVDATLTFVDGFGRIFPIYLSNGVNVYLKFEFIRKDVYNGMKINK